MSNLIIHFPNAPLMGSQETWRTQDPNIFFNEYHATVRTRTGKHFQYTYINQIMVKEGRISFAREYWDPRRRIADSMDFVLFR